MCKYCNPIYRNENWQSDITDKAMLDKDAVDKVTLSKIYNIPKINIYPKPYKASKFYSVAVRYCPWCGKRLNLEQTEMFLGG